MSAAGVAAAGARVAAISAKERPSPASAAARPVRASQRRTATSTYRGSSSMQRACRPVRSQAAMVVPLPQKGSSTKAPRRVQSRMASATSATGFTVGCIACSAPRPGRGLFAPG